MKMKRAAAIGFILLAVFWWIPAFAAAEQALDASRQEALKILKQLSLREKIGQKLMLDFRHWCPTKSQDQQACAQDFISMNAFVEKIVGQNHIGGVILFSNNLKALDQIIILTDAFQRAASETHNLPLLIGTDQEGGIVARLPRNVSVTFPGNMAMAAAYLGHPEEAYSARIGKVTALDLKAVGINLDFAPDVDVNANPLNPVIHVRAFSDDPELVTRLGLYFSDALQAERIGATLKHFPGHGDTTVDSHVGLPQVNHSLEEAWRVDLYPFKSIIATNPPALIMTAHIQFPALDNTLVYASKKGEEIITPATLSRKIQFDLLRQQLGFQGVIITDALDMGAIAENFDPSDAVIKAFQAGDDLALMPLAISRPEDEGQLNDLISKVEAAVQKGEISEEELNQSVLRIVTLKIKLGLLRPDPRPLSQKIEEAKQLFADPSQRELENAVANDAVTVVQNNNQLLPLKLSPKTRIHILMPWLEQGAGIAMEIKSLQEKQRLPNDLEVSFVKMADTNLEAEKIAIDNADIVIVGNITTQALCLDKFRTLNRERVFSLPPATLVFPEIPSGDNQVESHRINSFFLSLNGFSEAQFAYQALAYAKNKGKKTIFISLLAPYDLPNYKKVSDVMMAGYNFYGYLDQETQGYYRGPSMPAMTRIIFGETQAKGKLPVNIPDPAQPSEIIYPRGYGLSTGLKQ